MYPTRYAIEQPHTAASAVEGVSETEFVKVRSLHIERHRTDRIGWLRAAVLGANDGIVSTASLVV